MLCDKCGKNSATHFYNQTVNGKSVAMNLCSECAKKLGGFNTITNDPFGLSDLFSGLLFPNSQTTERRTVICKKCGKSFDDIMSDGKIGCSECYATFENRLAPTIEKIHGNAVHLGKVPRSAGKEVKRKKELNDLKDRLNDAIKKEDFENAALLRDEIKKLEADEKGGEVGNA